MKNPFPFINILTPKERDDIYRASLHILIETGALFNNEQALKLFNENGAEVDFNRNLVKIPTSLVKEALKTLCTSFPMYYQDQKTLVDYAGGPNVTAQVAGCCRYIVEPETGIRREAKLDDLIKATMIADSLEHVDVVNPSFVPSDIPGPMVNIKSLEVLLKYTNKLIIVDIINKKEAQYMLKMLEVVANGIESLRERPFFIPVGFFAISPLTFEKENIDVLFETTTRGLPTRIGACPILGVSTPITLAGAVAQSIAEMLAATVLAKLIDRDAHFTCGVGYYGMNYRDGTNIVSSPEIYLASLATHQILRYLGYEPGAGTGSTDAKIANIQAGYEDGMSIMWQMLNSGHLFSSSGVIDDTSTTSLETIVLMHEFIGLVKRIMRRIDVSEETIATDVIHEVGPGGNYLGHSHTIKNFEKEHWIPELLFKGSWSKFKKSGNPIMQKAREKSLKILETYSPKPFEVENEIEYIVKQAEKELL